jgi:uncharacterized protein (UPF0332 family)
MNKKALDLWGRALDSLGVAEREAVLSPDVSATCSYYAAFNSIGAVLSLAGIEFSSHDGVEILLHKDIIKPGLLPATVGKLYKRLRDTRRVGSYGDGDHVQPEEAAASIVSAKKIIEAVYHLHPGEFARPGWLREKG